MVSPLQGFGVRMAIHLGLRSPLASAQALTGRAFSPGRGKKRKRSGKQHEVMLSGRHIQIAPHAVFFGHASFLATRRCYFRGDGNGRKSQEIFRPAVLVGRVPAGGRAPWGRSMHLSGPIQHWRQDRLHPRPAAHAQWAVRRCRCVHPHGMGRRVRSAAPRYLGSNSGKPCSGSWVVRSIPCGTVAWERRHPCRRVGVHLCCVM